MGIFKNVTRKLTDQLDQMKLNREIEALSQVIRDNPRNVEALRRLAENYQTMGNVEKAISHFIQLASLYRNLQQPELSLAFYRKVERMVDSEQRATILKQMVSIYFDTHQFEKAYQHCHQIVSLYVGAHQSDAAIGFLKQLPEFGEKDAIYRKELREIIQEKNEDWMQGAKATWIEVASQSHSGEDSFTDRLILLVDDEPHVLTILEKILKPLGCQIMLANNGKEALEKAHNQTPSLIISDLMMPHMDGKQLFMNLQEDAILAEIPFVCLTSRDQEEEKVSAFEKGVEDYWGKPFSVKEIPARVKRLLRKSKPIQLISGQLAHISVIDLLNQFERECKNGLLQLINPIKNQKGSICFRDGAAVDANCEHLNGLPAILKMAIWNSGQYFFSIQNIKNANVINLKAADLILEVLHLFDEEQILMSKIPNLDTFAILSPTFASSHLAELPTEQGNSLLSLLNGTRTIRECFEIYQGDLEMLHRLVSMIVIEVAPIPAQSSPLSNQQINNLESSAVTTDLLANSISSSLHGKIESPSGSQLNSFSSSQNSPQYTSGFLPQPPSIYMRSLPDEYNQQPVFSTGQFHAISLTSHSYPSCSITFSDPQTESILVKQLYDAVAIAKQQCGESLEHFTFGKFQNILSEQSAKIKAQLNCVRVTFSVNIENGHIKFVGKGA